MSDINRDLEVLSDVEHIRLLPAMYVGSTSVTSDKTFIYNRETKLLNWEVVDFSPAFLRLFNEIFDNAYDELIRVKKEGYNGFEKITVKINSNTNEITVKDDGRGFKNADKIIDKTGETVVETAFSHLRASTNFKNDTSAASLIGIYGVGASAVNMLSDRFEIETINEDVIYKQTWNDFIKEKPSILPNITREKTGTTIKFIPLSKMFKKEKWNYDQIYTILLLKRFIFKRTKGLEDVDIEFYWDNVKVDLNEQIIPDEHFEFNLNRRMKLYIWPKIDDNNTKLSFINTSVCVGFHHDLIYEFLEEKVFKRVGLNAHHFYNMICILDLKAKDVKFKEQTKMTFDTNRYTFGKLVPMQIGRNELSRFLKSDVCNVILENIDEANQKVLMKNFKGSVKRNQKNFKISDKFYSAVKPELLYIVEGDSAIGSINSFRNPTTEASYALRGKIKNCRSIADLTESKVILDLINILGLNIDDKGETCKYKTIAIATDFDEDGHSICGLLILFFYRFFPKLIEKGKVRRLLIPLISYDIDGKKQFKYKMEDLKNIPKEAKNLSYLKGLGSIDKDEWKLILKSPLFEEYKIDKGAERMLSICFDNDKIQYRKRWLI